MIVDFVIFKSMGDVLMCTPVIHALRLKYPDSTIRVHVLDTYKDLLNNNPDLNLVVPHASDAYMSVHRYLKQNPGDIFVPAAMANHYDTCWHHNEETSNLHMIDFYTKRAGLPIPLADKHVRYSFQPSLPLDKPYAVFHNTTLLETKDWPIQYFNHLAIMIKEKYNIDIIQIGGSKDKPITGAFNKMNTSFADAASWIKHARFYVGVDSGNSYLAEAAGIPTFIVMGSTQALPQEQGKTGPFVGPVGPNVHYIEPNRPNDPNCRPIPCYNHCAIKAPCIDSIKPEDVFFKIQEVIK